MLTLLTLKRLLEWLDGGGSWRGAAWQLVDESSQALRSSVVGRLLRNGCRGCRVPSIIPAPRTDQRTRPKNRKWPTITIRRARFGRDERWRPRRRGPGTAGRTTGGRARGVEPSSRPFVDASESRHSRLPTRGDASTSASLHASHTHNASSHPPNPTSSPLSLLPKMVMGLSGLSLTKYVSKSPALMKYLKPVSERYAQACGYRQIGLKYDDLIPEETEVVQKVRRERGGEDKYRSQTWLAHLHPALHRFLPGTLSSARARVVRPSIPIQARNPAIHPPPRPAKGPVDEAGRGAQARKRDVYVCA